MSLTGGILLATGLNVLNYIPFTAIFLLTQLFGVRLYTVTRREDCLKIQKRVKYCSHLTNGKGEGYSIGYWYLMSISIIENDEADRYCVYMIATAATYEALLKDTEHKPLQPSSDERTETKMMTVYERLGSFQHPWFKMRTLSLPPIKPRPNQATTIEAIHDHHDRVGHTVAYLHGPPGSGKSMIGVLLAEIHGGSYCNTLRPWQPGDSLAALYSEVEPTKEKPLIVAFDEIDDPLLKIHAGIAPHKSLPISVHDKPSWNHMLDEIQRGMYPNLIILFTSNKTPEFIREMDPSYIREGRVDLIHEVRA
jgi:hypothetical protein